MATRKTLTEIHRRIVTVRIVGIAPLVHHRFAAKAAKQIRDKKGGKKTKNREICDPEKEGRDAMYVLEDGSPGIPAVSIKCAVISAAHADLGIAKTLVMKSLFIHPMGRNVLLKLETKDGGVPVPSIEEDPVRVGQGKGNLDLRYRPYYYDWAVTTRWETDADLLQVDDVLKLLDRAGFGVGLGEWRPECRGDFGRFKVDTDFEVTDVPA